MDMRHYLALVHKEPDSAYGVQFPDIPGVYSAADEPDAVIPKAIEALRLYAEDCELPEPSDIMEVAARPDVAQELQKGAFLVHVPLIDSDAAPVRANLSLERGLLRAIDKAAAARGLTRSAYLGELARRDIEHAA
jgi:predicted RNase H-like HicB family nuclease